MVLVRLLFAITAIVAMLYAATAPGRKPLDRLVSTVTAAFAFYFTVFTVWRPSTTLGVPVLLLLLGSVLVTFAFQDRRRSQEPRYGMLLPGAVSLLWGFALLLEADRIARSWPW